MRLYNFLSRLGYPGSYKSKIMTVAVVCTQVPMTGLLLYCFIAPNAGIQNSATLISIGAIISLAGTTLGLWAINHLLFPISATASALTDYQKHKTLPSLPTHYSDDAGVLMASTTKTLQQLDSLLRYVKEYDNLTSLPNRKVFESQLEKEVADLSVGQRVTVFLLDIDGFKGLNTLAGNVMGDSILCAIARRLSHTANQPNWQASCIARIGNDEFALFKKDSLSTENDQALAQALLIQLSEVYPDIPTHLNITVSIGIATYPADSSDAQQLIANAYTALQQAKQKGHNSYHLYSVALAQKLQKRSQLANDLRQAVQKNQLFLRYQPRIDWRDGKMVGVECLVRWRHPKLGIISPIDFISIAEETGLINPIGQWILKTACAQTKAWQEANLPKFTIAVNLSARQIETANFQQVVQQTLQETGLEAKYLELEVTEGLLLGDTHRISSVLQSLHDQGIAIALDDFGTGYSSLSYLRKFPFDILKIDKAFVRDIVESKEAEEVTRAIVSLAKGLNLGLIAEGVETEEQLDKIKGYGCNEIQGYYFSRPLSSRQLAKFVQNTKEEERQPIAA